MTALPDDRLQPHQPGFTESAAKTPSDSPWLDDYPAPESILLPAAVSGWMREHTRCPWCNRSLETSLTGGHTSLGPSLLQCPSCERVLRSHRREWVDRGTFAKVWYVFLSGTYVLISASLASLFTLFWCTVFSAPETWPPLCAAVFWGGFPLGLQIYRVRISLNRTRAVERVPVRFTFWSLDSSWQQKLFVVIPLSTFLWASLVRLLAG